MLSYDICDNDQYETGRKGNTSYLLNTPRASIADHVHTSLFDNFTYFQQIYKRYQGIEIDGLLFLDKVHSILPR